MKIKTIMALLVVMAGLWLFPPSARAVVLDWDLSNTYYASSADSEV